MAGIYFTSRLEPQLRAVLGEWYEHGFYFDDDELSDKLHLYCKDELVRTFERRWFLSDIDNVNMLHAVCHNHWQGNMEILFNNE